MIDYAKWEDRYDRVFAGTRQTGTKDGTMGDLIERLKHFAKGGSGPINDVCAQAIDEINALEQVNDVLRRRLALGEAENERLERSLQSLTVAYRIASGMET